MANELILPAPTAPPTLLFAPQPSGDDSLDLVLYVIFKRWKLILGVFLSFATAAAIAVASKPAMRSATAKILLKPSRMAPQISGMSSENGRWPFPEQVLDSELELMQSRDVLIGAARTEQPDASGDALEAAIQRVRSNLLAVNLSNTSVLELTYSAPSVDEAQRTLQRILDEYLRQHTAAYSGSAELLRFYETEKTQAAEALRGSEEARGKWQAQSQVVSIDQQIVSQIDLLASLRKSHEQARADAAITLQQDPLLARLQGDLMTSESALADLLQRYTEADRRVQEKRQQAALLRRQIAETRGRLQATLGTHQQALESRILDAEAGLASLREKKLTSDRLSRTVELDQAAFQRYAQNLDEARVAARLDEERLSNVKVIEAPHGTTRTDLRKRAGFVALSTVVGLAAAVLIAFGLSFLSPCVRARRDVEQALGLPVLALIPDMRERSL